MDANPREGWQRALGQKTISPLSGYVGTRDGETASVFIADLASRLANRVQLTSDGHHSYLEAVEESLGANIDYAMLHKNYGDGPSSPERKYSPSHFVSADKKIIKSSPDRYQVSTRYVERQNLTVRMSMRRFTRLTNAFPKQIDSNEHAIALHFMHYNFGRIHKTLSVTPAMEAGVA